MNSIVVKNISKKFKSVVALDDISFEVKPGEIFGLIGPDGAGKSTLMRILTTVLLADSGEAFVNSIDVKNFHAVRECVGYMPGRFSLYQDLSVEENLNFFATIFGTTIEENYHLIKDIYVQLEPFKKRKAGKLSGGMKQKLALCCALIHKPTVLFLDEPTTGVDPVSRKEFWEMLRRLKEENISILVSTPYMDEAGLCDEVALIQKGKIMQIDTPKKIVESFKKKIFSVNAKNKFKLIQDLKGFEFTENSYPFGETFHYIDKREQFDINEMKNFLANAKHEEILVEETQADIEDCFIALMREHD